MFWVIRWTDKHTNEDKAETILDEVLAS